MDRNWSRVTNLFRTLHLENAVVASCDEMQVRVWYHPCSFYPGGCGQGVKAIVTNTAEFLHTSQIDARHKGCAQQIQS